MAAKPSTRGGPRPGAGRKKKVDSPPEIKREIKRREIKPRGNETPATSTGRGGVRPGAGRKSTAKARVATTSATRAVSEQLESRPQGGALRGRKSKPVPMGERDMLSLLEDVALGKVEATMLQVRAAIAAVQYTHVKKGDGGKKDAQKDAAKKAGGGRFSSAEPPKLVSYGGRNV